MRAKSSWLRKGSGGHARRGHTPAAATWSHPPGFTVSRAECGGLAAERPAPPRTFESWSLPLVSKTTLPQLGYREVAVNTARARQKLGSALLNHVPSRPPPEKPRQGAACLLTSAASARVPGGAQVHGRSRPARSPGPSR